MTLVIIGTDDTVRILPAIWVRMGEGALSYKLENGEGKVLDVLAEIKGFSVWADGTEVLAWTKP